MKIASASVFSEAAPALQIWNTMRNPSAFLRKLSLNAEKNWHQNSGAKRRDVMRFVDMVRAFHWSAGPGIRRGKQMSGAINPMGAQRVRGDGIYLGRPTDCRRTPRLRAVLLGGVTLQGRTPRAPRAQIFAPSSPRPF